METGKADWSKKNLFMLSLLYEFLGSSFMILAFNLSNQSGEIRAIAFMSAYIFAVHVSGAHFNPATSLAIYLVEGKY